MTHAGHPGRHALVTGASRGLGRAVAVALAGAGHRVSLVARGQPGLDATAAQCGPGAHVITADLHDAASAAAAVDAAVRAHGPVHVLVHAAAPFFPLQRLPQLSDEDVAAATGQGLEAAAGLCRAVIPLMLGERFGRILMVTSLAASHGAAGSALYAATKAALEGLVRALAVDHGRHGITANALAVAFCDTERFRERTDAAGRRRLEAATALRRIPSPQEVAGVAAWLCSDGAGVVTGAVIPATAGSHLNNLW